MKYNFILVEPKVPENIGASARALKTMGFDKLVLVNPCTDNEGRAHWLAHGSSDILDNMIVYNTLEEAILDTDLIVATSTRKRWIKHDIIPAHELSSFISERQDSISSVAIVFGGEESGLSNSDMMLCDIASNIPLALDFPSLNLSQAVMLYAYELSSIRASLILAEKNMADIQPGSLQSLKEKLKAVLSETGISDNSVLSGRIMERIPHASAKDIKLIHSVTGAILDRIRKTTD